MSTVDGDVGSFKVIDLDTASIPVHAQRLVIGVYAATMMVEFHVNAQRVSVSPTMLSVDSPVLGALSATTPFAIFDFSVDAQSAGSSANGSLSEMYIVGTAISGQIGLWIEAPRRDQRHSIPTTASMADYWSADPQSAVQIVFIANNDLQNLSVSAGSTTATYRVVVALLESTLTARFSVVLHRKVKGPMNSMSAPTQFLSDGIPTTAVLAPDERQLFGYVLSTGWQSLTFSVSTTFGAPSMFIAKSSGNGLPAEWTWATSPRGMDTVHIANGKLIETRFFFYKMSNPENPEHL